jgi:hypothetical protein
MVSWVVGPRAGACATEAASLYVEALREEATTRRWEGRTVNDRDKLNARKSLAATVGGVRRAQVLSPERRREIAMLGVEARFERRTRVVSQVPEPTATGPIAKAVREAVHPSLSDGSGTLCPPTQREIRIRPWSGPAT